MRTIKNTLMIFFSLFVALLFSSCATKYIDNAQEGKPFKPTKGMLAGALRWKQAGKIVEPTGSFFGPLHQITIINRDTDRDIVYVHSLKKASFYLALDPGTYSIEKVSITRIQKLHDIPFNQEAPLISNEEMLLMTVSFCLFPCGGAPVAQALSYEYPTHFPSFQINEHEATYIGTLTIEVPDPLPDPAEPITPSFTFIDDQDETLNEFSTRFPGIERVKSLIPASQKESL